MKKETLKRYSLAFKQQVVREYETGTSVNKLRQKYGIGSPTTIERWIKKYAKEGYRSEVVIIQSVEDQQEYRAMKQRIADLETALADATLDNRMLEATLEVANQALDMDLKKSFGNKL